LEHVAGAIAAGEQDSRPGGCVAGRSPKGNLSKNLARRGTAVRMRSLLLETARKPLDNKESLHNKAHVSNLQGRSVALTYFKC
jgi:hypothetical protein